MDLGSSLNYVKVKKFSAKYQVIFAGQYIMFPCVKMLLLINKQCLTQMALTNVFSIHHLSSFFGQTFYNLFFKIKKG